MLITYNGISLLPGNTVECNIEPKYDDTGLDLLWQEVTISTVCVWSPTYTATRKPGDPQDYQGLGVEGDLLPETLLDLRHRLLMPRKKLVVNLGGGRVWTAPRAFANGTFPPCDPMGGPDPKGTRILQIIGEKTAVVLFKVQFAFSDVSKVIASHRWSTSVVTDDYGYSTRTIDGLAIARLDSLEGFTKNGVLTRLQIDDFRGMFAHDRPPGFIRKAPRVRVTPDGARLNYQVVDRELERNLGPANSYVKVEGSVTAGADVPFISPKQAVTQLLKGEVMSIPAQVWASCTANPKVSGYIKVTGMAGADRQQMLNGAIIALFDRLTPYPREANPGFLARFFTKLVPLSFYVTEDISNEGPPAIILRAEFMPFTPPGLKAMFDVTQSSKLLNLHRDIVSPDPTPAFRQYNQLTTGWGNPTILPTNSEMRGRWIGRLVGQILSDPEGKVPLDVDYKTLQQTGGAQTDK